MEKDVFDLEEKVNRHTPVRTRAFLSDLDFSAEPSHCYGENLAE